MWSSFSTQPAVKANGYTSFRMIDEATFRRESEHALETLKQQLIRAEERGGFEVEDKNGVMNIQFDDDERFVYSPNTPVRQIWISAQSTSFKLEWRVETSAFTLPRTGEDLRTLTERLVREQLDDQTISLV
jgi:iron donor protein CyaY